MRHFLTYYLITLIIFLVGYSIVFFVPVTQALKAAHNIFMILYPLVVFYLMIRAYESKALNYLQKAVHLIFYIAFISLLIIAMGFLNPADLSMNATEKAYGVVKISMIYGTLEMVLGLVMIIFIKQRRIRSTGVIRS
ncbi:hypothetical protein D770_04845 [Flammeovirgaceae bacterium 311]|nr:hypothetical protein D770_04845 [Flammeovirgaceae bacterium 311]